jgi:hypothetical protein
MAQQFKIKKSYAASMPSSSNNTKTTLRKSQLGFVEDRMLSYSRIHHIHHTRPVA